MHTNIQTYILTLTYIYTYAYVITKWSVRLGSNRRDSSADHKHTTHCMESKEKLQMYYNSDLETLDNERQQTTPFATYIPGIYMHGVTTSWSAQVGNIRRVSSAQPKHMSVCGELGARKQTHNCSCQITVIYKYHTINGTSEPVRKIQTQKHAYVQTNIHINCVSTSWLAEPANNQRVQVTTNNTSDTVCKQTKSCIGVTTVTKIHQTMNACKRHRTRTDICTHGKKHLHTRRYHKLISTAV